MNERLVKRVIKAPVTKSAVPMMTTTMPAIAIHWVRIASGLRRSPRRGFPTRHPKITSE
jgi:hypothetical protein